VSKAREARRPTKCARHDVAHPQSPCKHLQAASARAQMDMKVDAQVTRRCGLLYVDQRSHARQRRYEEVSSSGNLERSVYARTQKGGGLSKEQRQEWLNNKS